MKRLIGKFVLWVMRWRAVGDRPPKACVCLCAPHTSNWDFVLMISVAWIEGFTLSFLGKESLFKGVLGPFMRWAGGVPVDRSAPGGLVGQMAAEFGNRSALVLAVPAEGTRGHSEYWKSGFYRIAQEAGVPISMGFVDSSTRTTGFGPAFVPTGDLGADMDKIRDFYGDKVGLEPSKSGPMRLKEEDANPSGGTTSDDTASDDTASDDTASDDTASDEISSDGTGDE